MKVLHLQFLKYFLFIVHSMPCVATSNSPSSATSASPMVSAENSVAASALSVDSPLNCSSSFQTKTYDSKKSIAPILIYSLYFDYAKVLELSKSFLQEPTSDHSSSKALKLLSQKLSNPYAESKAQPVLEIFDHSTMRKMGDTAQSWFKFLNDLNNKTLGERRAQVIRNFGVSADLSVDEFFASEVKIAGRHRYLNTTGVEYRGDRALGEIYYLNLWNLKPAIKKIAVNIPEYQAWTDSTKTPAERNRVERKALRKIIETLLMMELTRLHRCTQAAQSETSFLRCVGIFLRDAVALHPYRDGNGRTLRSFAQLFLIKSGLRPSILFDPNLDYLVSLSDWIRLLQEGQIHFSMVKDQLEIGNFSPDDFLRWLALHPSAFPRDLNAHSRNRVYESAVSNENFLRCMSRLTRAQEPSVASATGRELLRQLRIAVSQCLLSPSLEESEI